MTDSLQQEELEGLTALVETLTDENDNLKKQLQKQSEQHKKDLQQFTNNNSQSFQFQLETEKLKQQNISLQSQLDQQTKSEKMFIEQIEALNGTIQQHKDLLQKYITDGSKHEKTIIQLKLDNQTNKAEINKLKSQMHELEIRNNQLESKQIQLVQDSESKTQQIVSLRNNIETLNNKAELNTQNKVPKQFVITLVDQLRVQSSQFLKPEQQSKLEEICQTIQVVLQAFK
ncbi:Hypothetical_protein [Hexamita inflata]|uniref:Hypothetical_protein n=1 Tax=Hexamita inflata TaxID=28002 RepID=A0AA86NNR8_9EUKA|nr:Hypothetical protein HINF_LOCUS9998 [Hexamita inflata]CAI9936609.1 Hypothetical protein HINF_LOCUS24254 [Hexamita inflata]